tara:strand:- start:4762 stop:6129 length:1368 start_codon:yes stop_codon:yes gene_type:complete
MKVMKKNLIIIILMSGLISFQTSKKVEDIVVIGGGLMGSSSAWQLSKYNQNVLLIEQQDSIYTFGSSLGEARISRSLGPIKDIFSFLQQTSVSETKDLIDYLNKGELEKSHSMENIYKTSPVTYIYYNNQLNQVENLLDGQRDRFQYASSPEQAEEKFAMKISDSTLIIREFKEYSGTLNPKVLIDKLHKGIIKKRNRIFYNKKVTGLYQENGIYVIKIIDTKTGVSEKIFSKKVISAAGPYNGTLLKDIAPYFSNLITPKRLFLSFLKINPNKYDSLTFEQKNKLKVAYPVANFNSEIFYSMIEKYDDKDRPLLKVGGHYLRTDIEDLNSVWEIELSEQEIKWSKENSLKYLNKLRLPIEFSDLKYSGGYSCVYSLTSSEIPYVTEILKRNNEIDSNFVIIGGMSGIGAKGSLAYGLIAADLILGNINNSFMYKKAKLALGSERLIKDLQNIEN